MSDRLCDLTADELMGMYQVAADRADKAEYIVKLAKQVKLAYDKACAYPDKDSLYLYSLKDDFARAETMLFEALEVLDKEGRVDE